ncbi:hypothetical protein TELCIR_06888 [Teladorsagia circumcincta]|uniref:Uncharacterized protein n=1 Tax=Teladorsagia circumcincta TaxID=45464 RepID=A0A2G9UNC4_TELCI|nr:hypothetical protein TELCIR_06888 [Teladorsagia circumcincta]
MEELNELIYDRVHNKVCRLQWLGENFKRNVMLFAVQKWFTARGLESLSKGTGQSVDLEKSLKRAEVPVRAEPPPPPPPAPASAWGQANSVTAKSKSEVPLTEDGSVGHIGIGKPTTVAAFWRTYTIRHKAIGAVQSVDINL